MDWMQLIVAAAVIVFLLLKYSRKEMDRIRKKGIRCTNPLPLLGDSLPILLKRIDALKYNIGLYDRFKGDRLCGIQMFGKPSIMVRDPELLRYIMVKDADHFINRFNWTNNSDVFLSKNLSLLQDEQWRNLRIVMTTIFTAAKMKDMFKFMEICSEQAVKNMALRLEEQMSNKGPSSNVLELEMKDYFSRYGTDVIASTAFGLEVDSFKNPNNEFYETGMILRNAFTSFPFFKMMFITWFPSLAKLLNITFFGKKVNDFFISTVSETIRNREKYNIVRKDVIHILTEARKGKIDTENQTELGKAKLPHFTDIDIAAQAMSFFFGGFDIMATALSFVCYEMAANPDIQERLYEDIEQVIEKNGGVTYDGVMHQMEYLDMVVKEVLRKWPPAIVTDRACSKAYTIPKTEDSPEVTLERGDIIMIPIVAFHRDPENYPDPEKFDPERFRDEKNTIKPFTYLPFGAGLRHCIALRYAAMEMKVALIHLIRTFQMVPTEKTLIPLKLSKNTGFMLQPENGFWIGLKLRA
ncbi:hypothetical protein RUM43_000337 [Polyplax serrata]|uniref:Cytochrome P450 n=1 Tax=Polyplax serrata TaxID=468196 RepID=A0AAN8SCN5_POLSC